MTTRLALAIVGVYWTLALACIGFALPEVGASMLFASFLALTAFSIYRFAM